MQVFKLFYLLSSVVVFAASPDLTIKKIVDLEAFEPYDTHLVHLERVWEGKTKTGKMKAPCVEVYDLDGKLEKTLELNFSPVHIFPNGENGVVVTGKKSDPYWVTFFARIYKKGNQYEVETQAFPEEYQVDHFVGDGKREIFALFGDRALLWNQNGAWTQLNRDEVIGPYHMVLLGDDVYVLNFHFFAGTGTETISKVNLKSGEVRIVSGEGYRQGVNNLFYHAKAKLIAFPERLINQVTLFDPATDAAVGSLPVEDPRGMASLGNCLAVASFEKRTVSFFHLSQNKQKPIAIWDLSTAGSAFHRATSIGIDEKSGRLFARSTYPSMVSSSGGTMSSVIMAYEPSQETRKACLSVN